MQFTKLHGLGNDFVLIDQSKKVSKLSKKEIQSIGSRTRGVGFDQLLLLKTSKKKDIDYDLVIYNTDGSRAEMCGNGLRAAALYCWNHLTSKSKLHFSTDAGMRAAYRTRNAISCSMGVPKIKKMTGKIEAYAVDVGNPHLVLFYWPKSNAEFLKMGAKLEYHNAFPNRVNVQFVKVVSRNKIKVRVWERGVGPTEACGTGAVASAFASIFSGKCNPPVNVEFEGGKAKVTLTRLQEVFLEATAKEVFIGNWLNS
ncbi:MAG: diaminopimelate epimerase [Bacteriovoracia bacterium]